MNKRTTAVALCAALLALCLTTVTGVSAITGYDSASDPLISKSYLEQYVNDKLLNTNTSVSDALAQQIKAELSAELSASMAEDIKAAVTASLKEELKEELSVSIRAELTADLYDRLKDELSQMLTGGADLDTSFDIVHLQPGQKLICTGFLELIVRTGGATVISSTDGLCDFTLGRDILAGVNVSTNHYIIIPRDDGRGLDITKADTYIMVRGDYEIR